MPFAVVDLLPTMKYTTASEPLPWPASACDNLMCNAVAAAAAAAARQAMLLQLVLPLAAQGVRLCPENPPVDTITFFDTMQPTALRVRDQV